MKKGNVLEIKDLSVDFMTVRVSYTPFRALTLK